MKTRRVFLLLFVLLGTAWANDFESWLEKAQEGDDWAQYQVGCFYLGWRGIPKDERKAAFWLEKSAAQGNAYGIEALADLYLEGGKNLPKNPAKAMELFESILNLSPEDLQAHPDYGQLIIPVLFRTAMVYASGEGGVPTNPGEAISRLKKGASQGDASSAFFLGLAYLNGFGGCRSDLAALFAFQDAQKGRSLIKTGRDFIPLYLGTMYAEGRGTQKDEQKALDLWMKSAKEGFVPAMRLLAKTFREGKLTQKDGQEAVKYYTMGAVRRDLESMYCLGEMYFSGTEIHQDFEEAGFWWYNGFFLEDPKCTAAFESLSGTLDESSRRGIMTRSDNWRAKCEKEKRPWWVPIPALVQEEERESNLVRIFGGKIY